jgi:hypothetical protein
VKSSLGKPYADSRLVKYLTRRILELKPRKTQLAIAAEAGFGQRTMLANIKSGVNKLPLDRVPGLAKALECDPACLFNLALDQLSDAGTATAIQQIFGGVLTQNERVILAEIRNASDNSDPSLTPARQAAIREVFGK